MSQYDLSDLVDWARRVGGDRVQTTRDAITSTGASQYTLSNDGAISIASVQVDGDAVDSGYTIDGNVLIFEDSVVPTVDADIEVAYAFTIYDDDGIVELLCDAAVMVQADLNADWTIDRTMTTITDATGVLFKPDGSVNPDVQTLIVCRAARQIREEKANQAADDSIRIRDGDTSIDTSATSSGQEKALKRMEGEYDRILKMVQTRRFSGTFRGA